MAAGAGVALKEKLSADIENWTSADTKSEPQEVMGEPLALVFGDQM